MSLEQTRYWLVAYETVHPKNSLAIYGADAAALDVFSAVDPEHCSRSEEHAPDNEKLLQDDGLWDMPQRPNVFFSQSELDYLTQGILRRMVLLTPDKDRGSAKIHAIPAKEPPPAGEMVSERYGIKVWRLPKPMLIKNEDPWKHPSGALSRLMACEVPTTSAAAR
jgi:hypothetical protein